MIDDDIISMLSAYTDQNNIMVCGLYVAFSPEANILLLCSSD